MSKTAVNSDQKSANNIEKL